MLARFNSNDWTVDDDGFAEITHTLTVTGDQYLRLRGTNVSVETAGETVDGEPLPDQKVDFDNDAARFDAINARNYNDLWFLFQPDFCELGGVVTPLESCRPALPAFRGRGPLPQAPLPQVSRDSRSGSRSASASGRRTWLSMPRFASQPSTVLAWVGSA